jgi:hypothetical protein
MHTFSGVNLFNSYICIVFFALPLIFIASIQRRESGKTVMQVITKTPKDASQFTYSCFKKGVIKVQ